MKATAIHGGLNSHRVFEAILRGGDLQSAWRVCYTTRCISQCEGYGPWIGYKTWVVPATTMDCPFFFPLFPPMASLIFLPYTLSSFYGQGKPQGWLSKVPYAALWTPFSLVSLQFAPPTRSTLIFIRFVRSSLYYNEHKVRSGSLFLITMPLYSIICWFLRVAWYFGLGTWIF